MTRNPGAATWASVSPFGPAPSPLGVPVDENLVVGVIDRGVELLEREPHPYIAGNLDPASRHPDNTDELETLPLPRQPGSGHGTFVAGRILREAPAARLLVRKALDVGRRTEDEAAAAHIRAMADVPGLKLVNLSFFGNERIAPTLLRDALAELHREKPEILVVCAAGNLWSGPSWPAAFGQVPEFRDWIVAVGAVDETVIPVDGMSPPRASFSNHGPGIDLYAPGVGVVGPRAVATDAGWRFGWATWSGTSFAAATVTGRLAALIREEDGDDAARKALERLRAVSAPWPDREGGGTRLVRAADSTWPGP